MKKLLLSILLLQSCSIGSNYDKAPREGETIVQIEEALDKKMAIYFTSNTNTLRLFYARKGLYNVGDTIKFTK